MSPLISEEEENTLSSIGIKRCQCRKYSRMLHEGKHSTFQPHFDMFI